MSRRHQVTQRCLEFSLLLLILSISRVQGNSTDGIISGGSVQGSRTNVRQSSQQRRDLQGGGTDDASPSMGVDIAPDICNDGEQTSTTQEYFLLELYGSPASVTVDDFERIQNTFVQILENMSLCKYKVQATVLQTAIQGLGTVGLANNDALMLNPTTGLQFAYVFSVEIKHCTPKDCDQVSLFSGGKKNRRRMRQTQAMTEQKTDKHQDTAGRSTSLSTSIRGSSSSRLASTRQRAMQEEVKITIDACNCEKAGLEEVLATWQEEFVPSDGVTQIVNLIPMEPHVPGSFNDTPGDGMNSDNNCNGRNFTKFSTSIMLDLNTSTGILTDSELEELTDIVNESYNEMNLLNGNSCDPHRRQILSASVTTTTNEAKMSIERAFSPASSNSVMVYVTGLCWDCTTETNLFDVESVPSRKRRELQDQGKIFCLCPNKADILRGPTVGEFKHFLNTVAQDSLFVETIVGVQEVGPILCSGEVVDFERLVPVQFEIVCELFDDDIPLIEAAFMDVYNGLLQDYYCDSYHRSLDAATVASVGERVNGNMMTFDFLVKGTCVGCDPEAISLFDEHDEMVSKMRSLFEEKQPFDVTRSNNNKRKLQTCTCNGDALADRGPTEVEFMDVFRAYTRESISSSLFCLLTPGICEYGTKFRAALLVAFNTGGTETFTNGFLSDLERAVLDSTVSLYNEKSGGCNEEFRDFRNVKGFINVDFNPNLIFDRRRGLQIDEAPPTRANAPSAFPTNVPTFEIGDLSTIVVLEGVCNGCSDNLVNSVWPGSEGSQLNRRVQQDDYGGFIEPSKCFCSANLSSTTDEIPSNDIAIRIQEQLEAIASPVADVSIVVQLSSDECKQVLAGILSGETLDSVCGEQLFVQSEEPTVSVAPSSAPTEEVCDVELNMNFTTHLLVQVGVQESLNDDQIQQLGEGIMRAFNVLSNLTYNTCDEEYREAKSYVVDNSIDNRWLDAVDSGGRRTQTLVTQTILLEVEGSCGACKSNSSLFNPNGLTEARFVSKLESSTDTIPSTRSMEYISFLQEVELFECSSPNTREIEQVVIINFIGDCSAPSPDQLIAVAEAFMLEYNEVTRSYCDPHRRNVMAATVVTVGMPSDGVTPLEIQVIASCVDCKEDFGIFDIPTSAILSDEEGDAIETMKERRRALGINMKNPSRMLQESEICICPANPVGSRAPFEAEFIDFFTVAIEELNLDCFRSCEECNFRTSFESGIVVEISRNSLIEDPSGQLDLSVIEASCKCAFRSMVRG